MKEVLVAAVAVVSTVIGFVFLSAPAEKEISVRQLAAAGNGIYRITDAKIVPALSPYIEYQDLNGEWRRIRVRAEEGTGTSEITVVKQGSFVEEKR